MNLKRYKPIISTFVIGGWLLVGLLLWLNSSAPIARADPGELFVTPGGTGTACSQATPCALQTALDRASDGDTIYLAGGAYTGSGGAVVTVTHSITLYGGWDGSTTTPPARDPGAHSTTLDGAGARQVVNIPTGNITPTLDGLRLTNGSANYGGGLNAVNANAIVCNCHIFSNTANYGGGVHVTGGDRVKLVNNHIYSNTAVNGGGVRVWDSDAPTIAGNQIYHNTGDNYGGGILLLDSRGATLTANRIYSNSAPGQDGGGVYLSAGDDTTLTANQVYSNSANYGGGLYLRNSDDVTLINNVVAHNRVLASHTGSGVYLDSVRARFYHTTLARNHGGLGQGIYVDSSLLTPSTVWMTNTVLVSHTVGIRVTSGHTATLYATLWGTGTWANDSDATGSGTIITAANFWGDPAFLAPDDGDYHVSAHSAAINQGTDAGVTGDIDGDPRPYCAAPDLGADESPCCVKRKDDLFSNVQAAVDLDTTPDHAVLVAGTCRGVLTRDGHEQAVYITKTVTIQGGYTDAFDGPPDPGAHPTTLDAVGQGRVIFISGDVTPTLEGLRLTNGRHASTSGGGVRAENAHPIISDCHVFSNTASSGGGVYFQDSANAVLAGNQIYSNTVNGYGGGIFVSSSDGVVFKANAISYNNAGYAGGGIAVLNSQNTTLTNNMVLQNQIAATRDGAGVYLFNSDSRFLHNTLARNHGGDGQGLYGTSGTSVEMTNTILVSHAVGVEVSAGSVVTLTATLWGAGVWANSADTLGSGTVLSTTNHWGDPAFVDPGGGDYHIGPTSAAIDRGVAPAAGVNDDIDGDPRPQGRGYDVGADEFACTAIAEVTITGPTTGTVETAYTFSATVSPLDATPPMTYTWSPEPESGQGTSSAQYRWASSGVYTLTLAVENCGGGDVTPHTITIEGAYIYLPLILKN